MHKSKMIPENKKMKVLLINSSITVDENDYMDDGIAPPLGLGYLGAGQISRWKN